MPIWPGSGQRSPWEERSTVSYTPSEVTALQDLYEADISKVDRDEQRRTIIMDDVIQRLYKTPYMFAVPSGPVGAVRNGEHAWKRCYVPHPARTPSGWEESMFHLWAFLMICPMKDHGDDAWLQAGVSALATIWIDKNGPLPKPERQMRRPNH
jgi:hypothetical protein